MNQDGYANQSSRIALSNDSVFNETAYTILFILCPEQDFLLDLKPWKLEGGEGGVVHLQYTVYICGTNNFIEC